MRWLWFVLSVACFAVAFRTHSMGLAAVALLAALAFLLMFTLALASSRIESRGREASEMMGPQELLHLREMQRRKQEQAAADAAVADAEPEADTDSVPAPGDDDRRA